MKPLRTRVMTLMMSSSSVRSFHSSSVRPLTNVNTKFVLIETKHPWNVGAAARALKNMGFKDLALIRPNDDRVLGRKKCIDGASGAVDVLNGAKIYDCFEDLFKGEDAKNVIICGTGMPVDMSLDRPKQRYVAPRRFFDEILAVENETTADSSGTRKEQEIINIAFLFGNERFGMNSGDMEKCDVMLGIPTNPEFGSLNVASAVQIIAYDWREAIGGFDLESNDDLER